MATPVPASTADITAEKLSCSSTTRGFCFTFDSSDQSLARLIVARPVRRALIWPSIAKAPGSYPVYWSRFTRPLDSLRMKKPPEKPRFSEI
jgi:hypothetical protein